MEAPSTPTTPSVKEQVRQLRQKKMPIRKIAQELGVTKHAVETALKELEPERLQTLLQTKEEGPRTSSNTACRTDQTGAGSHPDNGRTPQNGGQTLQNHHRTGPQTPFPGQQTHPNTVKKALQEGGLVQQTQQKAAEKDEKTAKTTFSYTVFSFKADYSRFLKDFQRDIQQQRCYWRHHMEGSLLAKLKNLQKRGQCLAQQQGLEYDELLLSDVLQACGSYMENVLRDAPVVHTLLNLRSLKFPPNKVFVDLCQRAQQMEFDFVEPKHASATA